MLWVHFHGLLGNHVRSHGVVAKGLRFHDALHVGRPAVLGSGQNTGGICHAGAHKDLLHLVTKDLLHELSEWLKLSFQLLNLLLLILIIDVKTLLGGALELLAIELLQLLRSVLIDGVNLLK